MAKKKLTNKQQAFIDYYLGESKMNATDAARRAGYKQPKVQGAQNLSKLNLEIKKATEARHEKAVAKQDEIFELFTSIARAEETETIVTSKGQIVEHVPAQIKDRLKAAELLGRAYAMFTDKQEVELNVPTFVDDVPEDDADG